MLRLIVLLSIFFSVFVNPYAQSTGGGYVTDEIFIRFKDSVSEQEKNTFAQINQLRKIRSFFITKAILFKVESGKDASEVVNSLNENPIIKYADLNRIGYKPQSIGVNEPGFPYQWYLSGDYLGNESSTIKWKEAMEIYSPKKSVGVAVIDSGIANYHPDLVKMRGGMIAEQNGFPNLDDDGFGFEDDAYGWNFVDDNPYPEDDFFHGTLVSGIISGDPSNGIGITGIAPDSFIVPLKVMSATGSNAIVSDLRLLLAVEYSVMVGVKIINLSMKFISPLQYSQVLQDAALELSENYDTLLVCAAGNDSLNNDLSPIYPASYEGDAILSVAASDQLNSLSPFSHYGVSSVDLAAPGEAIFGATVSNEIVVHERFDFDNGWTWGSSYLNQSNYRWNFFTAPSDGQTWVTDSDWDLFYNPLNYTAYTDNYLKSPWIDLTSTMVPKLNVKIYHDLAYNWLFGSYDFLHFEISLDDQNWFPLGQPVYGYTPYPGRSYSFDLSSFGGYIVKIRFRLQTDGVFQGDGVFIDDFIISGVAPFSFSGDEFEYSEGTSFAAPIVSGVAAMLLSHRPELSTQDVRKIILQSVSKVDGLADKVASGGIVNAYEAIKLADAWEIDNSNSWSSSLDLGNGWKSFSWFGSFFESDTNWIYHINLGWLYRYGDNLDLLWFYSMDHGWLFTSDALFPYMYNFTNNSWLYLQGNRLLLWTNGTWTTI